ncbi:MAG: LemA family protein [Fluviicola sp.]
MKKSTIIFLVVVGLIAIWAITSYNGMIGRQTEITGQWGEVENQYQRRLKLYKNVIATIKGSAKFEKGTLEEIVRLRSRVPETLPENDPDALAEANRNLNAIKGTILNINVEAYPDLKSTSGFRDFQTQIEGTENRVSKAIGDWNALVTDYNKKIVKFPSNIMAGLFGFEKMKNFKAEEGAKEYDVKDSDFNFE